MKLVAVIFVVVLIVGLAAVLTWALIDVVEQLIGETEE